MTRTDVTFPSGDAACAAWLYTPETSEGARRPVVVMAHGLGSVKEKRLDAFAERFTAAGYMCLVFDYRNFGASGGEPRQLLDIDLHPFTDGLASSMATPPLTSMKLTTLAIRDLIGARLGRAPIMAATYGPPGSTAFMSAPDCAPGSAALIPEGMTVRGEIAARFALHLAMHFPGRHARNVDCPILFVICERDSVAPAKQTKKHAATAPHGEITLLDAGHFDIYVGEWFERNVTEQLAFLARHVPVPTR